MLARSNVMTAAERLTEIHLSVYRALVRLNDVVLAGDYCSTLSDGEAKLLYAECCADKELRECLVRTMTYDYTNQNWRF